MWERLNCGGMGGPSWAPMGRPWVVGWVGGGGGDGGAEEFGADPANTWHGPSSCQDAVRSKKRIYCRSCKHLGRPPYSDAKLGPWALGINLKLITGFTEDLAETQAKPTMLGCYSEFLVF